MDLAGDDVPVLFLLDELLHGTNSNDRRKGTAILLSQFLSNGAVGLVTTHDLGVAEAENRFNGKVENVHFSDQLVDGLLQFDYKVRPGVVQRSNALDLMRAVGLRMDDLEDEG
jgi:DNA mismatch repair ATPase MutS